MARLVDWDKVDLIELLERATPFGIHGRTPTRQPDTLCLRLTRADLDEIVLAVKRSRCT